MSDQKKPVGSLFEETLAHLSDLERSGIRFVPKIPSPAMTQAGVRAGGVAKDIVERIYRAMIEAESFDEDATNSPRKTH